MGSRGAPGRPGTGASSRPNRANAGLLGCWARGRQYSKRVIRGKKKNKNPAAERRRTSTNECHLVPPLFSSSTAPHGALAAAKRPSLRRPPSSRLAPRRLHLFLFAQPRRAVVRAPALVTQHAERRETAKETQADDGRGHDRGGVRCVAGCCAKKGAFRLCRSPPSPLPAANTTPSTHSRDAAAREQSCSLCAAIRCWPMTRAAPRALSHGRTVAAAIAQPFPNRR
jgi:hypothetical protein